MQQQQQKKIFTKVKQHHATDLDAGWKNQMTLILSDKSEQCGKNQ